jgi:hypothetical protein
MKKIVLVLMVALFSLSQLVAQESTFKKGDNVFNLGVGLGSTLYSGIGYTSAIPPLSLSFETCVADKIIDKGSIGVGGYLGYQSYKWQYTYFGSKESWKYSDFIIAARGTFHYPFVKKLDTYTGVMVGFDVASVKWIGTGVAGNRAAASRLVGEFLIGARYYFTDNFGVMCELGYGITYINFGINFKL